MLAAHNHAFARATQRMGSSRVRSNNRGGTQAVSYDDLPGVPIEAFENRSVLILGAGVPAPAAVPIDNHAASSVWGGKKGGRAGGP